MKQDILHTSHPDYGKVVHTPDGRVVCHICGKAFTKLGAHVVQKHEMTSREYKEMYGLDVGKGLITDEHRMHLRGCVMRNYDKVVAQNLIECGDSTRFVAGGNGRTRDMMSEQTRIRLAQNRIIKTNKD